MLYQFRFDLLFLFVFVALLILHMTMVDANKSDVKTANAAVETQNNTVSDNPVVKN